MKQLKSGLFTTFLTLIMGLNPALQIAAAPVARMATATALVVAGQHYTMVDLTPAGGNTATAAGLAGGQEVGTVGLGQPSVNHAFLWNGGTNSVVDLSVGSALATNGSQQVGSANSHAALWSGTPESLVDLNPGIYEQSAATSIANGQQVGWATRRAPCVENKGACGGGNGTYSVIRAYLWTGTAASGIDLTPFNLGYEAGRAWGTDGTQQVGFGYDQVGPNAFSGPYAVVWSGTYQSAVSLNPNGSASSEAKAVAGGQQVGYAFSGRAMLWRGTAASGVSLHPTGFTSSQATGTNGVQQAGVGSLSGHSHALVWSGTAASAVDLNQYTPLGFSDAAATGIDTAGNVVGWASTGPSNVPANVHAVMWMPSSAAPVHAQSVGLSQAIISVGDSVQATVALNQPAPAGGALINLRASVNAIGTTPVPFTVNAPASTFIAEGQTSVAFNVTTELTTTTGFTRTYLVDVQAAYGDTTQTAVLTVNPPVFASALTIAPDNVEGETATVGTVTLNRAAPAGGALVTLASNNVAATVPASVTIAAGATSATFPIQTIAVTTFTTVTVSATFGSTLPATVTDTLIVAPPQSGGDVVAIQKADYVASKRQLTVQASSTNQFTNLAVTVTSTGQLLGYLLNKGAGSYQATFNVATNPANITVTSDLGGTASLAVRLK